MKEDVLNILLEHYYIRVKNDIQYVKEGYSLNNYYIIDIYVIFIPKDFYNPITPEICENVFTYRYEEDKKLYYISYQLMEKDKMPLLKYLGPNSVLTIIGYSKELANEHKLKAVNEINN